MTYSIKEKIKICIEVLRGNYCIFKLGGAYKPLNASDDNIEYICSVSIWTKK